MFLCQKKAVDNFKMGKNSKQKQHFSNKFGGRNNKSKFNKSYHNNGPVHRQHRGQSSKDQVPKNNLSEDQVGITEYLSKIEGFQGVIKARFSDFHVNEIDLEGNIIKLTDQQAPEPINDGLGSETLAVYKKELESIITEDVWTKIDEFLKGTNNENNQDIKIDVTELDKDKRTLVHKTLKEEYGNKIVSSTVSMDDKKFIQCRKSKGSGELQRSKWLWAGEYVYFVVHKENTDTVQAASDLAQFLRLKPSMVNYAGTKDKRAKTSQRFCVKKREPSQILRSAKRFPYLKVGNFEFKDKVLKLGDLKGNRFRIALRHVNGDNEKIEESLQSLKINGFINYFGLQRFGNCAAIPTYQIGIALLKGDYKEACELILKPRDGDSFVLRGARECWWKNRNSAEAAEMIHNNKFLEKKLLDGLARFGEHDYANSLRRIPRNMLLLYTHSFQSFIWNKIASRRFGSFGLKLIPGDLVYKDVLDKEPTWILDFLDETLIESAEDEAQADEKEESESQEELSVFKAKVFPLTEENIKSGKYTIFDVILPLPGYDITYPANEIQQWYEDILGEYGLSSDKLKSNVKTYSLTGAYRKLIIKPENMSWKFKQYDSSTSTLISSDYEDLKEIKTVEECPDGKFKALLLDFALPASSYATMALREILKCDTSASNQTQLNESEMRKLEISKESESDLNKVDDDVNLKTDPNNDSVEISKKMEDSELKSSSDKDQDETGILEGEVFQKDDIKPDEVPLNNKRKSNDILCSKTKKQKVE